MTTWPHLQPAGVVDGEGGPDAWDEIPPNQRFVPQSPFDPVDPEIADECLEDCGDDCEDCDCGCHQLKVARSGLAGVQRIAEEKTVSDAFEKAIGGFGQQTQARARRLFKVLKDGNLTNLIDAILAVACLPEEKSETPVAEKARLRPHPLQASCRSRAPAAGHTAPRHTSRRSAARTRTGPRRTSSSSRSGPRTRTGPRRTSSSSRSGPRTRTGPRRTSSSSSRSGPRTRTGPRRTSSSSRSGPRTRTGPRRTSSSSRSGPRTRTRTRTGTPTRA